VLLSQLAKSQHPELEPLGTGSSPNLYQVETVLIMTNRALDPQQCWQIHVPIAQFPKSKFQFGEQVAIYGEDDLGNHYCDIGVIVGMEYIAEGDQPAQWYYRIKYLKFDDSPWLVGTYDLDFVEESRFVADDTEI
jgi:ubiquitin C-terminal hydrolase